MDTIQAITDRRSVRKYKQDAVNDEDLRTILEAGRQAPSGGNRQPWEFVIVTDDELKQKVADACNGQMWMADAGVIIAGCGLPKVSEKWWVVDPTIALQNMVLAATALGYGTCWIGAFKEDEVKGLLNIPEDVRVICLTPLGVPDADPPARPRREPKEIFRLNDYDEPFEP
ncbi:MAG: nitroreductase family protein [Armatimonadota bacterium]|jgi:nitroreductase